MNVASAKIRLARIECEIQATKRWLSSGASSSKEEISSTVSFLQDRYSQVRKLKTALLQSKLQLLSSASGMTIAEAELLVDEMEGLAESNLELGVQFSSLVKDGLLSLGDVEISKYFEEYRRILEARAVLQEKLALLEVTTEVLVP